MCRVTTASSSTSSSSTDNEDRHVTNPKVRLLVTLESFHHDEYKKACLPNKISCFITTIVILIGLFISEYVWRYIITSYQHLHPLLDNEIHRNILARHIGVDTVCCIICVLLGFATRHAVQDVFHAVLGGTNKKAPVKTSDNDKPTEDDTDQQHPMPASKYQERLLQFEAGSFRLALFFFIYQIKNTYDTILWNDGPEFIFHHVFSMITAYGCMFAPTIGHMYAVFFFGLSELSTAVLCLLANFDDVHGVPGLGDALPNVKVVLAVVFTICFILCRVIIWPIFAYYFCRDVLLTLKHDEKERKKHTAQAKHYRGLPRSWLYFFLISLSGISCLQVAWLGQIFILGQQELNKMGYI